MRRSLGLILALCCCTTAIARADEGYWTFDNFPSAKVQAAYGFAPTRPWLDHVQRSTLRIAEGCSASFVSPEGLVMTNHHCAVGCVEALSRPGNDYVTSGFYAPRLEDEMRCPGFEIDQLISIQNVSDRVASALAGKTGAAANSARDAIRAQLQASCGNDPAVLCEFVSLYHGGVYDLYHYRRFSDVRLVFAPEFAVAQFGGDPDNFEFPRYDYDVSFVRVYAGGKPFQTPDYLRWNFKGAAAGDLVFAAGNPGFSEREDTISQVRVDRDVEHPAIIPGLAEYRGLVTRFRSESPARAVEGKETLFFVENALKETRGEQGALLDPDFFNALVTKETTLLQAVAARPELERRYGDAWTLLDGVEARRAALESADGPARGFFTQFGLLGDAVQLVRAASERTKPNAARLPGYTDQDLVGLAAQLEAPIPVFKDLETLNLSFFFSDLLSSLGPDSAITQKLLGKNSPGALAQELVSGTKLDDPAVRRALFTGGEPAIAASTDPLIVYARRIDPTLRAIDRQYRTDVTAPERAQTERIAHARFAITGTSVYPDATFTLRLSYGTIKGFPNGAGIDVPPFTTIGGLFNHATGHEPFALPQKWLDAKPQLDPNTPMNFATTNDVLGGNSGSPVIDRNAEIVGIVFDGNIFSLGGTYGYDPVRNRTVALDARAILAGLRTVYHADRITDEIAAANR
ncbi:MAG: S46 family peptidase [Vulcanimicrobiaceae bacterium]